MYVSWEKSRFFRTLDAASSRHFVTVPLSAFLLPSFSPPWLVFTFLFFPPSHFSSRVSITGMHIARSLSLFRFFSHSQQQQQHFNDTCESVRVGFLESYFLDCNASTLPAFSQKFFGCSKLWDCFFLAFRAHDYRGILLNTLYTEIFHFVATLRDSQRFKTNISKRT